MVPGFGKQIVTIGSAPSCDVVIPDGSVHPEHARIVHQGGGRLVFIGGSGPSLANGRPIAPGEEVAFDFRTQFVVGNAPVPLSHPAIVMSIMTTGSVPSQPGQHIIGRDPARASLVIQHPSVSSQHATVMLDRMSVIDNGSTSGTYVGATKIAPSQPTPIDPNGIIAFGPVPVSVELLMRLAQASRSPMASMPQLAQAPMPAQPSPVQQSPEQNRSRTTRLQRQQSSGQKHRPHARQRHRHQHPQVSSRHALLHNVGGQLFIEDRGSANGTYVHGHRIAPGQKIPVQSGEKIYIGPMPLQIEVNASGAVEVVQEQDAADVGGQAALRDRGVESDPLEVPDRDNPAR
jgi:pSer/pThr/pTyr-binding forkhead associated (FHA) protein